MTADDKTAGSSSKPHQTIAVMVAHGIGQQRPFQALDSFVHGLARALPHSKVVHCRRANGFFDHFVQVRAPNLTLDVFEFYWASLTQGKISFTAVIRWIWRTAFTPLLRLAYNIPLIRRRAKGSTWRLAWEWIKELARTVRVFLLGLVAAGGIAAFVALATSLAGKFWSQVNTQLGPKYWAELKSPGEPLFWAHWGTALVFMATVILFSALVVSLPAQIRDFSRVQKYLKDRKQNLLSVFVKDFRQASSAQGQSWWRRAVAALSTASEQERAWQAEIRARRSLLFVFTPLALAVSSWIIYAIRATATVKCFGPLCISPIINDLLKFESGTGKQMAFTVLLVGLAALIKQIYVDYIGDVALYTTADENNAFYETRMSILNEATRKLRWLLMNYDNVAVAGHSLGSVIVYDAIGWLQVETQTTDRASSDPPRLPAANLQRLRTLVTFGSPLNKVLYFFRTTVAGHETVRGHILNELHGFRLPKELKASAPDIGDEVAFAPPDKIAWLNCYSPSDPISASLDFYEGVEPLRRWYLWFGAAHLSYWHDAGFYSKVIEVMQRPAVPAQSAAAGR